jgi:hypothetical protein
MSKYRMTSRHRVISILVRGVEFGLAALFLYLGTTKFFAPGASTPARVLMASGELAVGLLILARVSEMLSTPAVIVVAAAEVGLFGRPPLAAMVCVSAHGLATWGRIALGRRQLDSAHERSETPLHDH